MKTRRLKTLVLGLGNPILTDDGVGCQVAAALKEKLNSPDTDIKDASVGGLNFIDLVSGYDRVIIVDAIQTGKGKPGQISRLGPEDLSGTLHSGNPHDVNLPTAIELGRKLKLGIPDTIIIFAIEVEDVTAFGETCTPEVARAIPSCVEMVIQELQKIS